MNRIHSIGFEFVGKLGKNKDTGQMRLMPFALFHAFTSGVFSRLGAVQERPLE